MRVVAWKLLELWAISCLDHNSSGDVMSCSENDSRRRWLPHGLFLLLMGAFLLAALSRPVAAAEQPVSFVNDVVPVLTKAGCNVGVCHAKAGGGQKG